MYNDSLFNTFARSFEARRETDMPIAEYLESCRGDPMRYANAAERILAAIGEPQMIDTAKDPRLGRIFLNRTIRAYPAFSGFYGMEETIERIVSFFRHAAQGLEERKQILYLLGPVGGGKSSLAERLKSLMEVHPIYVLKADNELSPVFESPFGYHIVRVDRVAAGEVKARHILIRPKLDSADLVRAHVEADTVAKLWKAGMPFDSLAKKHHDYAAKEETSILDPMTRDSLPESYQRAFANKSPNDIFTFEIPDPQRGIPKVVVAQLLSANPGGEYELKEMREMVRSRLADEGGVRRYLDGLRKRAYVSIRLDQPVARGSSSSK